MADPIELLESFPRSLSGAAPDPGNLRERGDRRRTRHRAVGAVAALVVIAALITPFALRDSESSTTEVVTPPDAPLSLSGVIPGSFPLRMSLPVTSATGAWEWDDIHLAACGRRLPDLIGRLDPAVMPLPFDWRRDGTRFRGATYEREVMTFGDAAGAQSWADTVAEFYRDCSTETINGVERIHELSVEADDSGSVVSVKTHDEVDGTPVPRVQLDRVYVVGTAVLFTQFLDETSTRDASQEELELARPVVAAMGHSWVGFPDQPDSMITGSSQVPTKLRGASTPFREFIGALADQLAAEADCPGAAVGVTVDYVVDDKWALGNVNQCGGYVALWGRGDNGRWGELHGTQEMWSCATLERLEVPEGIVGPCSTEY